MSNRRGFLKNAVGAAAGVVFTGCSLLNAAQQFGAPRRRQVEIVPLDEHLARSCGELCGAVHSTDVIDASVVILARERRDPIVTSDPNDLRRLDPAAQIIPL